MITAMRASLAWVSWYSPIGLAEHDAVLGVLAGRFVGGLHDADGPGRGLQPAVLEPGHLVVEAPAQAVLAADEVVGRHEPVVEGDLVGVHAPVADGVDRPALHLPAAGPSCRPGELEAVAVAPRLRHDEQRQAPVGLASGRGRCGPAA